MRPPALALGNELLVKQFVGNTWAVGVEYEPPIKTLSLHGKPSEMVDTFLDPGFCGEAPQLHTGGSTGKVGL